MQTKYDINSCVSCWICRTYADKLSPKVVQSLLDLLCSQLKNLLSQAGVSLLSAGSDQEDTKHEDGADSEKKDFRGDKGVCVRYTLIERKSCCLACSLIPAVHCNRSVSYVT